MCLLMAILIFVLNSFAEPVHDSIFPFACEQLHLTGQGHPVCLMKVKRN
jgi:hypothetical protein